MPSLSMVKMKNSDYKVENSEEADNTEVEPLGKTENESVKNPIDSENEIETKLEADKSKSNGLLNLLKGLC